MATIGLNTLRRRKRITWTPTLIKMLRGKRTRAEFGKRLGVSSNTIWRWEARRAAPDRDHARRLSKLAKKERFLEGWTLVGTGKLLGDLEEADKELKRMFRRSLLASARALYE
jgi:transcriptional regulator with XRE-family HTH domain